MRGMTAEELQAAYDAGAVSDVTLKGDGGDFLIEITTRSGAGLLTTAGRADIRRFDDPITALALLHEMGITIGHFDARRWKPHTREEAPEAYSHWLLSEIDAALADPAPSLPHDEVMADVDRELHQVFARAGRRSPR
ncbi:hypothetical protein [Tistrella mobilis]|uniref:antitoxin PaaA2 family protein n=1 Tax=Tistrella mobilis TaxID=171437 RepID=UPI003558F569